MNSTLSHLGIIQLVLNSFAIIRVGLFVEYHWACIRFIFIYIFSALGPLLFSVPMQRQISVTCEKVSPFSLSHHWISFSNRRRILLHLVPTGKNQHLLFVCGVWDRWSISHWSFLFIFLSPCHSLLCLFISFLGDLFVAQDRAPAATYFHYRLSRLSHHRMFSFYSILYDFPFFCFYYLPFHSIPTPTHQVPVISLKQPTHTPFTYFTIIPSIYKTNGNAESKHKFVSLQIYKNSNSFCFF